jgi:molecular chaperone GrpE
MPENDALSKNNENNPKATPEGLLKKLQDKMNPSQKEATEQKEAIQKPQSPESKIKELTETLQRLQAEFENFQKRNSKQNDDFRVYANAKLIESILPVLDSLESGMQHSKELVHIYEQLYSILKKNGVEKIVVEKGKMFDHETMECLMQDKNEKLCDGAVANVIMGGYLLNGKILRLPKVSVNVLEKKQDDAKKEEKEQLTKVDYEVQKMEE